MARISLSQTAPGRSVSAPPEICIDRYAASPKSALRHQRLQAAKLFSAAPSHQIKAIGKILRKTKKQFFEFRTKLSHIDFRAIGQLARVNNRKRSVSFSLDLTAEVPDSEEIIHGAPRRRRQEFIAMRKREVSPEEKGNQILRQMREGAESKNTLIKMHRGQRIAQSLKPRSWSISATRMPLYCR